MATNNDQTIFCMADTQVNAMIDGEVCGTLTAHAAKDAPVAAPTQYGDAAGTLAARHDSSPCADRGQNVVAMNCRAMSAEDGLSGTLQAKSSGGYSLNYINPVMSGSVVRRLTPRECERLQGMPTVVDLEAGQMTSDEVAACALANGDIFCDLHAGKVYGRRGPGGALRSVPVELGWMHPSGYVHINLSANGEKHQVRAHRVIYMAAYGHIPDGMVVDHINNDKSDNRISNLQLMTVKGNSAKAARDGRYPTGEMNGRSKLTVDMRTSLLYDHQHGLSYRQLAQKYGVSKSRVGQIVHEDDWTMVPYRGRPAGECPDGPRYKAIGNSMAVPVMRWIGERVAAVLLLKGDEG